MRVCAVTMVFNEPVFLKLWHKYYSEQLEAENLYVIDHGSTDGCTSFIEQNVLRVERTTLDETERAALISATCSDLLKQYDVVIFGDADELVIADPAKYFGLLDYLTKHTDPLTAPIGLDLQHIADLERRLDVSRPILRQRHWVRYDGLYSKPIITRVPVQWSPGFHGSAQSAHRGRDIYLFHLKAMDKTIALAELSRKNKIQFSKAALDAGHSVQFHFKQQEMEETYFSSTAAHLNDAVSFEDLTHGMPQTFVARWMTFGPLARVPERFHDAIPGVPRASLIARAVERVRGWRVA